MTRSKELRRIQTAVVTKHEPELRWALAQVELRKSFTKRHSDRLYRLEKEIRQALGEAAADSD